MIIWIKTNNKISNKHNFSNKELLYHNDYYVINEFFSLNGRKLYKIRGVTI